MNVLREEVREIAGIVLTAIGIVFFIVAEFIYEEVTEKSWIVAGVLGVICLALWLFQVSTWLLITVTALSILLWFSFELIADEN